MKLKFCAACGSADDLQHHHLVTRGEGRERFDDEHNLITLCYSCHLKLHERRASGVYSASERIREAKRHQVAQGISSGGKTAIGFNVVLDGEIKRLVPNAAEIKMIESIKAMRSDGATLRAISTALANAGHITSKGKPYSASQIARILSRSANITEIPGPE